MKLKLLLHGAATSWRRSIFTALVILVVSAAHASVPASSGVLDQTVSLQSENESLKDVLAKIQTTLHVTFLYKTEEVQPSRKVSVYASGSALRDVLDKLLTPLSLQYAVYGNSIVLKPAPADHAIAPALPVAKNITGKITGFDTKEPMPGVNVLVKGTTQGTTTDANGQYAISVSGEDVTLVFSFIGYTTEEVVVGTQTVIDMVMMPDITQLQDVVVIGYGSLKRTEVLGAVASVAMKESSSRNYNSAAELLQGTVAGVTVLNNGGDPTSPPSINIRGIGSINAESPLIVLDGVIYAGSFNTINPEDIASISVLKDAASAAIYGARASGGVILVTTKKRTQDKMNLSVNYQQGFQDVAKKLHALNAADYADAMNTATDNAGLPRIPAFDVNVVPTARTTKTVWMDEIFQTGKLHNLSVSLTGGSQRSNFFISGGYRRNEGILLNTWGDRYTARVNSSHELLPNLKIGENISYSLNNGQTANTTSSYTGAIISALYYPPNATVYREDGSGKFGGVPEQYPGSYGDVINPVAYLKRLDNHNPISTLLINPYVEWEIIKGLRFRSNWGITRISNQYKEFQTKITEPGKIFDFNSLTQSNTNTTDLLSEQTLAYDKVWGDHDLKAVAGYTYQHVKDDYYSVYATGFSSEDPSARYIVNANLVQENGAGVNESYLISYLARANYAFRGKYMLSGVVRRDGTSRLLQANRWKVYPSVSAGWLVSDESFLQSVSVITNLKLRASYGEIGNLGSLRPYQFSVPMSKTTTLLGQSPTLQYGYAERELSNSSLVWESSRQTNVGLDFGLLKNRLTGTFDVFRKTNEKMLIQESLPGVAGAPSGRTINAGNLRNSGIELGLSYGKREGELTYDVTVNYAHLKNKVMSLTDGVDFRLNENATQVRSLPRANVYMVGSPVNAFYGYQTDGIFKSNDEAIAYVNSKNERYQPSATAGDFRFKDTNGDGVINDKDRVVLGTPFPTHTFSLNGNIRYKGFDLNVFFQGVAGNKILNAVKYTGLNPSVTVGYNLLAESRDAWTPQNPNATIPKLSAKDPNNNFGRISDFYMEDASFLRLRNLTIGYTVKNAWIKSKANMRIYVSGQNLLTFTRYSGMDPEIGLNNYGIDLGRYPLARIYMAGVQVDF